MGQAQGVILTCRACGEAAEHRTRSDAPTKPRTRCKRCEAAYLRQWRARQWQRRKAYDCWKGMIRRCHDPSTLKWASVPGVPTWRDYGAKGITVCKRWRESFEAFLADVGLPPTREATLDRRRNTKNYTPSNCRWVDIKTQQANRKNTRWVTAVHPATGQETRLWLSEWGRQVGIDRRTIAARLNRGWTPNDAVGIPVRTAAPF